MALPHCAAQAEENTRLQSAAEAWATQAESADMRRQRESLPAWGMKDAVVQAVAQNQVVVISGETGSGKTTQV